jgi:hypothetical protein
MNAERLLGNFDRVADAPGSIAHLRRFILDLANPNSNSTPCRTKPHRCQSE